tara:strand:+ start:1035 stop:1250 length:216 start_codon:yes stop_codon:yes gene_type:complete
MTTLIVTLVLGVGAVIYLIRIGKQLEKSGSYKAALGIHGKINRAREEIRKQRKVDHKRLDDDPRSAFGTDD